MDACYTVMVEACESLSANTGDPWPTCVKFTLMYLEGHKHATDVKLDSTVMLWTGHHCY